MDILDQVLALHRPAKIYNECECPAGTHPDDYDYIDCEDYVGCENSLSGIGCEECCVGSWGSLTEDCSDDHSHGKSPNERCRTVKLIAALMGAGNE